MLKNKHKEFPSDLFLLFETVGADVTICTYFIDQNAVKLISLT